MTPAANPPTVPGLTGLTVLARGGYATVYRAVQESIGRDVAVKVENRTLESDRDRQRFMREARAAGRMSSHPHVVDLFDAGVTADNHPYLIMELCDGTYAERMRSAPLDPEEAREVGYKIADALADGHSLGVLHRDVKPANILFSNFGEPALADFGLAILSEWRDVSITLDVLTPAYAPPEAFRQAHPTPAADVYALCATLYALMRGRPPRWRDDRTPSLASVVDMFAERIPDVPGVPAEMMALLRAGLANDETSRPTAVELRDALQAMRFNRPPGVLIPPLGSPRVGPDPDEVTVPHGHDDQTVQHARQPLSPAESDRGGAAIVPGTGLPGSAASAPGSDSPRESAFSASAGPGLAGSGPGGAASGDQGVAGSGPGGAASGDQGVAGSGLAGAAGSSSSGGAAGGAGSAGAAGFAGGAAGAGSGSGGPGSARFSAEAAGLAGVDSAAPGVPGSRNVAPVQPGVVAAMVPSPAVSTSRRTMWVALIVTGFAVVALVAVGAAYARNTPSNHQVFKTPAAVSSQVADPSTTVATAAPTTAAARTTTAPASPGTTALAGVGCGPIAPTGVTCPATPDCYDNAKHPVACSGTHTWEAFAVGQLPAGVPPTNTTHDPNVLQACSRITLLSVAPQTATGRWELDVLPPTGSSRTYRCLAGRGPNALLGSQLAHR